MLPLRLLIDTNVLVSAALKPDGLQRTVFLLALTKPARLYVSEAIFSEYREVLSRPERHIRFVECADAARADYLITGNQRHFPKFWKQTKVITTRELGGPMKNGG